MRPSQCADVGVIQVKPGIGDVIWHLPFIRAIAAAAPGGKVVFLAPPSSRAQELLAAEPGVAETIYFRHAGSELERGVNLIRLVAVAAAAPVSLDLDPRSHHAARARRHARRHPATHRLGAWRAETLPHQSAASTIVIFTTIRSTGCAR